ncbi:unnamed protein product [Triticum turgidum subsp. durum]|uniref:RNA-binding S4 domain-containing protein n=1 Tax=Triticum turgidum subsp. durum TaxID=4567 RepID=A0A9R0W8S3_TRITD|nr:unnamed protein product [Triticum turgidum subsp. durum]
MTAADAPWHQIRACASPSRCHAGPTSQYQTLSHLLWSWRLGALHLSQPQSPAGPQNPRLGSAVEKEVAMMACRLRFHQRVSFHRLINQVVLFSSTVRLVGVRPTCCSPSRDFAAVKSQKIQPPKKKKRLDEACLERYQQYSRTYIQSWILQGKVHVNGRVVNKAGTQVSDKSVIEIKAEIPKYVCRAGHKLEAAIKEFRVDCDGKIALDSGLSTGGFTDCLLQHGASHVYGVDVGYGQVAEKIRVHEHVSVIERTNLRHLSKLPQLVDLVTLDLSFISILVVMPAVVKVMKTNSTLITLIKPQFEARRSQVGKGGIVRDPLVHKEVLDRIISGVEQFGFRNGGWIESPLKGAEGNTEFLACFERIPMPEPHAGAGAEPHAEAEPEPEPEET